MKRILLSLLISISFFSAFSQDAVGLRVIAKQSLWVKDYWIKGIQRNSALSLFSDSTKLPTAKAVADYVNIRIGNDSLELLYPLFTDTLEDGTTTMGVQGFDSLYFNCKVVNDSTIRLYRLNGDSSTLIIRGNASSTAWGLRGNIGTDPTVNYLGTNDDHDLIFKRNGLLAGSIRGGGTTSFGVASTTIGGGANTAMGAYALQNASTATNNVAVGFTALQNGVDAQRSVALGEFALGNTTTGIENVGVGQWSNAGNINGNYNVTVGSNALRNNQHGSNNVYVGYQDASSCSVYDVNNSITIGSGACAVANTFQISSLTTKMKFNLESGSGSPANIAGIDGSGNWKTYPYSGGSSDLSGYLPITGTAAGDSLNGNFYFTNATGTNRRFIEPFNGADAKVSFGFTDDIGVSMAYYNNDLLQETGSIHVNDQSVVITATDGTHTTGLSFGSNKIIATGNTYFNAVATVQDGSGNEVLIANPNDGSFSAGDLEGIFSNYVYQLDQTRGHFFSGPVIDHNNLLVQGVLNYTPATTTTAPTYVVVPEGGALKAYAFPVPRPYKVYTATLTQSGTDAPVATVLENTIGAIVWSYVGPGNYNATLTGGFTMGKVAVIGSSFYDNGSDKMVIFGGEVYSNDGNTIPFDCKGPGNDALDGELNTTTVEIRVYN